MRRSTWCTAILAVIGATQAVGGQQIAIDRGLRAGGLWCFPLVDAPRTYVYIPAGARLATDERGAPQFSFVRYVVNEATGDGSAQTITSASGGGVVHFLVLLETPERAVALARSQLKELSKDDEVELRGPIVFENGRYLLVSSILNPQTGEVNQHLFASGRAPVLEGNRLAFSFELEPERASLLFESFQMATPDISVVFDMTFQGLTDAYQAEMTIDWSEVRSSQALAAGASVYFVSADVELAFERLRRDNAIKLRTSGSDASMEALLTTVYTKLLELLFRPVEPERVPEDQRGGLMDALNALVDTKSGPLGSRNTTGFGAYVGYQLKDLRSSGLSVLDFDHRSTVERHAFITWNIGDLYRRHGNDPDYFRAVNLDDATFQQRQIHVGIDGSLLNDFDRYINSVTLTLRKQHESGEQTLRELVVDRAAVEESGGDLRLVYGWKGDGDRLAWLEYDSRTSWSFKGGGSYHTDWTRSSAAMLELFTPYERREVQLSGDLSRLAEKGVRAVIVQVEYPFFSEQRRQQMVVRPGQDLTEQAVEITLPRDQFDYQYTITWRLAGGEAVHSNGRDGSGLIFIDELPEESDGPSGELLP